MGETESLWNPFTQGWEEGRKGVYGGLTLQHCWLPLTSDYKEKVMVMPMSH